MGSVYLRNRVWWFKFYTPTGSCVRRSAKTTSKRRAEMLLAQEVAKAYGRAPEPRGRSIPRLSIGVALEEWEAERRKEECSKNTRKYPRRLATIFGIDRPLSSLTAEELTRYGRDRCNVVASPTAHRELASFAAFLDWCVERGYLAKSPADDATFPSNATRRRAAVSMDVVAAALEATKDDDSIHPILLLAFCNGVCRGEMAALRWEDIDLERAQMTIRKGKTAARRATMAIHPTLLEWLKAHKHESGPVLTLLDRYRAPTRKPVSPDTITRRIFDWNRAAASEGRPTIPTPHLGRHTLATFLVQNRVPIERVSKILRHARIATTDAFYAHLKPVDCAEDLAKFPI